MDIKELSEQWTKSLKEMTELTTRQSEEIKANKETAAATAKAIEALDGTMKALQEELKQKDARLIEMEKKANRFQNPEEQEIKTLGSLFCESENYKEMVKAGRRSCGTTEIAKKDITSAAASAGSLTRPMRRPEIFFPEQRTLFVADLLPRIPVTDNAIEIMRELAFTNNAGPQYDAGATPTNELVVKNKSDITFELDTIPVRTLAHYFIASRQVLSDIPRLRNYIDQRGIYGLQLEVDEQILFGDGTGQNLTGLMVDPLVSDINGMSMAEEPLIGLGGAMLEQLRSAITECQINEFYNVNGVVLNPRDWQLIELAKGNDGHYIWVSVPQGAGQNPVVWRVPVIVTNAMNEHEFILGDWRLGATLYDRESINVRIAEQHADLFIRNGVVILIEERLALGIERPLAFTKGTFLAGTT